MAPIPLEGVQMPVGATPQEGGRGGSISLAMLIDLIVQRTYHELTVLAELLPRKTDMERKIEIFNYAARTRQLFVRLLALVKWANSASKVDKSAQIMLFLDKQSLLFVDTADMLARMARDTLVHARLPNFHIPAAVEVLTTGSYSRLPACIRDRIVPPDPITPVERRTTLDRLNRVIQHRLVTGHLLPQMRNLKIEAGRVTFTADREFQVSLTVMGDGPNIPWRLLDIDILVDDKETGDGKALVHPLQVQFIHQVVQARLVDNPAPLSEVYYTLHFFCQSLQLEVLYSQTLRLCRDRLDDLIQVGDYTPGKCLSVSYWKELAAKDPKSELGYWLTVQVDQTDPAKPLSIVHLPSLPGKESEVADKAIRSDHLSMERLLVHTIYLRTKRRLAELKEELETLLPGVECGLQGSPAILSVPVLQPCLRAENLLITVDTHTGMLQCHVPQYDPPLLPDLQAALNSDRTKLASHLSELRFWMTIRRCEKTLQHLPATAHDRLPLLHLPDHPMTLIGRHRVYIRLHRHPNVIILAELKESGPHEVETQFYMAVVKPSSIEDNPDDDSIETEIPKMYLKVMSLIEFDTFLVLHGPLTNIEQARIGTKRKATGLTGHSEPPSRRAKQPAYFIPELAHVVAFCEERIPFVTLAQELSKRGIDHQGLQVEANATTLVLRMLELPQPANGKISPTSWRALSKRLLSVSLRANNKGSGRCWIAEVVLHGSPLTSQQPREAGLRRPVYFQYDMGPSDMPAKTVDNLLADWSQIVNLYDCVEDLAEHLKQNKQNLSQIVTVKSFTYSKLVLGYGPDKGATVTVQWCEERKAFTLLFSASGRAMNAHSLLREQLEAHLNRHRNLPFIIHLLYETYLPMLSISKLPIVPQLGVHNNRPQVPVQTFTVLPQSHTLIRLVYQGMYCLEIRLKSGGYITIRDGAYSRFDRSNVVEELTPTQGLKAFLGKYVEETAALRRRSQCEDDDPPSPVTMDTDGVGGSFLGPRGPHSPASGLKFHAPVTPPSGSNPHTPASPHTGLSQTHSQTFGSPATSFNLASPPSLPPTVNPSPSMLPHASPGGLLASSPSNPMHVASPAGLLPIASPGPVPPGHSPGYLGQSSHLDGSPFPASHSPAVSTWPGSPSLPRPSPARPGQSPSSTHLSRVLPQRSWAGAVPTQLTHEALDVLCTPSPHPQGLPGPDMSPLERFLGCVYMRRQLQRFIQAEECLTGIPSTEPLVVLFKVETLQCRVALNSTHLQSLHLKVTPLQDFKEQWSLEDLQLIERAFDTRAAAPPYKPMALSGFGRMLNVPLNVLKDFVQIIRLELVPGMVQQQGLKWAVQWSLRVPPSATPIVPVGQPGVIICKTKLLFFLQLTRIGVQYLPGMEPPCLVLPLVYDFASNITQLAEKRDAGPGSGLTAASMQLKRFAEFNQHTIECTLFPAVRDLLANLMIPSEPPQMISSPAHTGSVTPTMQPSPAMMHSPMSVSGVMGQQGPMNPQGGNVMGPQGPGGGMPVMQQGVQQAMQQSMQGGMPGQGPSPYPGMGMGQHMMAPN